MRFDYADESDPVPYPLGAGHQDRGRRRRRRRPARDRRRQEHLPALRDLRDPQAVGTALARRLRRDLVADEQRAAPGGWTSADAAGLPILPGLLRYDEVEAGHVDHAIRFTTNVTDRRLRVAGPAPGRVGQRAGLPADGRAVPAQGVLLDSPGCAPDTRVVAARR